MLIPVYELICEDAFLWLARGERSKSDGSFSLQFVFEFVLEATSQR